MENKYELKVSPVAQEEFLSIFRYISEELKAPEAARKLWDKIYSSIDTIRIMPH